VSHEQKPERRWQCVCCTARHNESVLLRAPSPFMPAEIIRGCPTCLSPAGFIDLCDEPGCDAQAGHEWVGEAGGVRHTCWQHDGRREQRCKQEGTR